MALTDVGVSGIILIIFAVLIAMTVQPLIAALGTALPVVAVETVLMDTWSEEMDLLLRAVVIDKTYSHALIEHPDSAEIVWNCFADKGAYITFQIEPGKRFLRVCLVNDTTVGFQIVDIVGKVAMEKTAYIKEGIKCLKELFEYAKRMGYPRFNKGL